MGPEGIILVNPPITTFQQSLTYSAAVLWALGMLDFILHPLSLRSRDPIKGNP